MKKNVGVYLWTVILICLAACSENEGEVAPGSNTPEIVISSSENQTPVFDAKGGTATISFTATADWSADVVNTRAENWLTVTPVRGGQGDAKITISTVANDTPEERNATVFLRCGKTNKSIVITQKQKDALTVTSDKYTVPDKGGNIAIEAKSNVAFEVEIKNDWIKRVETRALSTTILNFAISPNETGAKREGEIVLKSGELSETIKIYQEFNDFIVLTKDEFMLSDAGGTVDIEVKSTVNYGIKGLPDWITEVAARNISTHTLHYMVAANETYDAREAKIVFYDKGNESLADTVTIYQAYQGAIIVARNEYEFDAEGGVLDLAVQSNIDFDVTANTEWIKRVLTRGLQEHLLHFNILPNDDVAIREGVITISSKDKGKSQSIRIKQQGKIDYKALERNALIAFYRATDGDNWKNNENWCTDADISTWYGISVLDGHVVGLELSNNNLSGTLPEEIGELKQLSYLQVSYNNLSGELPKEFYSLTNLYAVYLQNNKISGSLSEDIRQLIKLNSFVFSNNQIEGTLPFGLSYLVKLTHFEPMMNRLSGRIPSEVMLMPNWNVISKFLEPQQPGYSFTATTTKAMIDLGDNFYLHPNALAIEYRQGKNEAIKYEEMKPLFQKMYTKIKDDFDFVICLYNVGNMAEIAGEIAGQFFHVNHDIKGVGVSLTNESAAFGSGGNLNGIACLSSRTAIEGVWLHELMHNWGTPDLGQWSQDNDGVVEASPVHWGISSVDGILGGFKLSTLQRNVDGNPNKYRAFCSMTDWCFPTVNASSYYYAPLELYLMGLIPPSEVPDTYIYDGISGTPEENVYKNGIFYATTEKKLTIQDIISKIGERVPNYQNSQKNFRVLTLVITKNPVDDREWLIIEDDILKMQKQGKSGYEYATNFWEATGGRATLKMDEINLSRK